MIEAKKAPPVTVGPEVRDLKSNLAAVGPALRELQRLARRRFDQCWSDDACAANAAEVAASRFTPSLESRLDTTRAVIPSFAAAASAVAAEV